MIESHDQLKRTLKTQWLTAQLFPKITDFLMEYWPVIPNWPL